MDAKSPELHHLFLLGIRNSVDAMRAAGLNEAQIGCIVQDIRSFTLNEEFRRIKSLIENNPPYHHTWVDTMKAINKDSD